MDVLQIIGHNDGDGLLEKASEPGASYHARATSQALKSRAKPIGLACGFGLYTNHHFSHNLPRLVLPTIMLENIESLPLALPSLQANLTKAPTSAIALGSKNTDSNACPWR